MGDDSLIDALLSSHDTAGIVDLIQQFGLEGLDFNQITDLMVQAGIDPTTLTDAQVEQIMHATGPDTGVANGSNHAAPTHRTDVNEVHFGNGCDCGYSPGNCGSGQFCRWTY